MNTVSFLAIPAGIVPDQEAIVSGSERFTYADTLSRVRRLRSRRLPSLNPPLQLLRHRRFPA